MLRPGRRLRSGTYRRATGVCLLLACALAACDDGSRLQNLEARVAVLEANAKQGPAWVLWAHWAGGLVRSPDGAVYNPHRYEVVQAYASRAECDNARDQTKLTAGYDYSLCLPETVKPQ
jgi:hypothetical protein